MSDHATVESVRLGPRVYAELVTAMDHGALAIGGALPALSGYGEQARRDCHLNHVWKGGWT